MPFKARYANTGAGVSGASRICDTSAFEAAWFLLSQSSIVSYVEDSRVSVACRTLVNCGMFIFHPLWFSAINEKGPNTRPPSLTWKILSVLVANTTSAPYPGNTMTDTQYVFKGEYGIWIRKAVALP